MALDLSTVMTKLALKYKRKFPQIFKENQPQNPILGKIIIIKKSRKQIRCRQHSKSNFIFSGEKMLKYVNRLRFT